MRANVNPASILFTDDWRAYRRLKREYLDHRVINLFGNLKTGMRGAYKKVSPRYLQSYLNEYAWRYNQRHSGRAIFDSLLLRAASHSAR